MKKPKKYEEIHELSQETIDKLNQMNNQIIEEMIKEGYTREQAEDQVKAFS